MSTTIPRPLFALGRVVATPDALEALRSADLDARELLRRHAAPLSNIRANWRRQLVG